MTIPIYDWNELNIQWDHLLLGNGASIALDNRFAYSSLYEVACSNNLLQVTLPIFQNLNTNDFEQVLLACWYANIVNNSIGSSNNQILYAYNEIRDALIAVIQQVHCLPDDIEADISRIGYFASRFSRVLSFNYDLTFYWAMMNYNENNGNWFKDGFVAGGRFDVNWRRLEDPYRAQGTTMVFFPHGNLMLGRDINGLEFKINALNDFSGTQTPLLDTIIKLWHDGMCTPLFVSEGTADQKMRSISRSPYLSTVYNDVLANLGGNIVVYGFSFSENDKHILQALRMNPPNTIAISVFDGLNPQQQQSYCHYVLSMLNNYFDNTGIFFYNSQSSGCWNNN